MRRPISYDQARMPRCSRTSPRSTHALLKGHRLRSTINVRTDSSARRWPAGGNASDDNRPARTGFLNVAIEATAIGSARGGDETYARELLHGLALAADPGDRFVVYLRP